VCASHTLSSSVRAINSSSTAGLPRHKSYRAAYAAPA
jgi:hypothetical protein